MASDYELKVHRGWIGLLQPVGLVVSPPALVTAQAFPDKNILEEQQQLTNLLKPPEEIRNSLSSGGTINRRTDRPHPAFGHPLPHAGAGLGVRAVQGDGNRHHPGLLPLRFADLATTVLKWKRDNRVGAPGAAPLPESLDVVLPEFGETLRPTYAVPALQDEMAQRENASPWMILVQELSDGSPLDALPPEDSKRWRASAQTRFERLLRETGVSIGILCNGRFLRLVYAPRGETSGHITWPVDRLITVMDRDMLSVLCMLLGRARLFTLPREQRLPHILRESRKYQSVVSTKLANQVLEALNELLRGFQGANEATRGALLDSTVRENPDHIYGGLLAVLLRLVFVLYAEERGLLSTATTYVRSYSLIGLFDRLRSDAGRFPDTMDQRFGAWSRLIVLFRMVHDGAKRGDLHLPPRYGHLFDSDGWSFLEGRAAGVRRSLGEAVPVPRVPDGVIYRVLEKLLLLEGDRLSYRALALRAQIQALATSDDVKRKQALLRDADEAIARVRMVGDAVVASFFAEHKAKAREQARVQWETKVLSWMTKGLEPTPELRGLVEELRTGEKPVPCFHWELEFPAVFAGGRGGFDAMVGNPPFLGGSRLSTEFGTSFEAYLKDMWPALVGKIDLVLYFLHRASRLISRNGTAAFIATYRVADGANALAGLRPLTLPPWKIFWAIKERAWPGEAQTRISQLAFTRRVHMSLLELDGRPVDRIGCDLRASIDLSQAADLNSNEDICFLGAKPDSLGFMLTGDERQAILQQSPSESAAIRRYMVGKDLLYRPGSDGSRWIIDFSQIAEESARFNFPMCFEIVEKRVRPIGQLRTNPFMEKSGGSSPGPKNEHTIWHVNFLESWGSVV